MRIDPPGQRHTVVIRRLHPGASAQPPDIVRLPVPDGLACAVLHPHIEVQTGTARGLIGDQVALKDATRQWANVGALVAALYTSDLARRRVARRSHRRAEARIAGAGTCRIKARRDGRRRALGAACPDRQLSIFALAASLETARAAAKPCNARLTRRVTLAPISWVCPLVAREQGGSP